MQLHCVSEMLLSFFSELTGSVFQHVCYIRPIYFRFNVFASYFAYSLFSQDPVIKRPPVGSVGGEAGSLLAPDSSLFVCFPSVSVVTFGN